MRFVSKPGYDPLCESPLRIINGQTVPTPSAMNSQPCVSPLSPPFCCCSNDFQLVLPEIQFSNTYFKVGDTSDVLGNAVIASKPLTIRMTYDVFGEGNLLPGNAGANCWCYYTNFNSPAQTDLPTSNYILSASNFEVISSSSGAAVICTAGFGTCPMRIWAAVETNKSVCGFNPPQNQLRICIEPFWTDTESDARTGSGLYFTGVYECENELICGKNVYGYSSQMIGNSTFFTDNGFDYPTWSSAAWPATLTVTGLPMYFGPQYFQCGGPGLGF